MGGSTVNSDYNECHLEDGRGGAGQLGDQSSPGDTGSRSRSLTPRTTGLHAARKRAWGRRRAPWSSPRPSAKLLERRRLTLLRNAHPESMRDEAACSDPRSPQRPALTSQTRPAFAIFDSTLLKAAAGFSSGMETIKVSPSHATLCFMEFLHRGALFILLFSLTARKLGSSQRNFSTALSDP